MTRRLGALGAALIVPTLVLAGCGGSGKKAEPATTPAPTSNVSVPDGVSLTDAGSELKFGDTATVAYEPNTKRNTVLQLRVLSAQKVSMSQLSMYVLDARSRQSTPYFVRVAVTNVGTGDVGATDVPIWLVDQTNTLIHSSSFTNSFKACPSGPLPKAFGPGAATSTCLVYLVPDKGQLTALSFRPVQAFEPITWTGTVTEPAKKAVDQPAKRKKKAS